MATPLTYNAQMLLDIRTAIQEAVRSGAASATLSAGGGSEAYTRHKLAELHTMEREYANRVNTERLSARATLMGSPFSRPDFRQQFSDNGWGVS